MTDTSPPRDLAFADFVAATALRTFATNGGLHPFAVVGTDDRAMIVPSEGFADLAAKEEFVNVLRFLSIEHGGQRSAMAMETWTMFSDDPDDIRLMDEIQERGGSVSEHPAAGEALLIVVESDAGTTTRLHRIVREDVTVSLQPGETDFEARQVPPVYRGTFSDFHMPTDFQSTTAARDYAAQMRELVPHMQVRIDPVEGPSYS